MSGLAQALFVIGLGLFWGISPALNKTLGLAGVPVSHILVAAGFGVGLGLMVLQRAAGERIRWRRPEILYGFACAVLINVPWGIGLAAIRHVPVTLSAVVTTTTPLWTFAFALAIGRERFSIMRLLALVVGLASCIVVIVTRPDASMAGANWWLLVTAALPLLYAGYNVFTSAAWPIGMTARTAGVVESLASGVICLPLLFWPGPSEGNAPALQGTGYLLLFAVILMWIAERFCYFSMIQHLGSVSTVQAVYVATPAAVLFGFAWFGETVDLWLLFGLVLLMASLWLNNQAVAAANAPGQLPAT
jgi:drug/metabolite transporter (DMT)-like permease